MSSGLCGSEQKGLGTEVNIYLKVPCSDPALQDCVSKTPFTILKMAPEWNARVYDEYSNPPVVEQTWRISANNNDDVWWIKEYDDACGAAFDWTLILISCDVTTALLRTLGFTQE